MDSFGADFGLRIDEAKFFRHRLCYHNDELWGRTQLVITPTAAKVTGRLLGTEYFGSNGKQVIDGKSNMAHERKRIVFINSSN